MLKGVFKFEIKCPERQTPSTSVEPLQLSRYATDTNTWNNRREGPAHPPKQTLHRSLIPALSLTLS